MAIDSFADNKACGEMIEYLALDDRHIDGVRRLLADNGWEKRVADEERFRRMVENASRAVVAVSDGEVVGFARALTDEISNGYIGTVIVASCWRRNGVGREMISRLMGDDPEITWVLRAGHGSEPFWRKMGFEPSAVAMERRRSD